MYQNTAVRARCTHVWGKLCSAGWSGSGKEMLGKGVLFLAATCSLQKHVHKDLLEYIPRKKPRCFLHRAELSMVGARVQPCFLYRSCAIRSLCRSVGCWRFWGTKTLDVSPPHWSELQKDIKKSPTLEVFKEEGCFETDGDCN